MPLKRYNRGPIQNLPSIQDKVAFFECRKDVVYGTMIPEPDYSDDDDGAPKTASPLNPSAKMVSRNNRANTTCSASSPQKENKCSSNSTTKAGGGGGGGGRFDEKGLILPKKLANPCSESTEKKSLHRELLFNQKLGVSVLNQKSELQKALEKHKDKQAEKASTKESHKEATPLQRAIEERAQRMEKCKEESKDKEEDQSESESSSEFQKVHAKFRSKIEAK